MTLAELSKKYGVHPNMISTRKRAAIANMASAFERGKSDAARSSEAEIDKLHSKIGQLVIERDFFASASHQLLGTRGKNGERRTLLSQRRQCALLRLSRSNLYYRLLAKAQRT